MSASFRKIKSDVRARIARGDWSPGETLPTEADLAQRYACARATVNRALRELADEGLLERRRKSGTRVRTVPLRQARLDIPLVRREIEEKGAAYRYALVLRDALAAPDWLAARLGLKGAAPVLHLIAMHYADGAPYQHEDRWIALDTVPQASTADFTAQGPNEWLVAEIPFTDAEISFLAAAAEPALAAHLGCRPGDAVFRMERVTWLGGAPVTFVRMSYPPGHRVTTRY
ncbi:GntR family transcriptional regulator [Rhodosalinus sp.]|uniref:GntR family transcriptional regulator n=1 Tax=Rhodosalinus sp. TaxID=2047741 RepID=UPI003978724B